MIGVTGITGDVTGVSIGVICVLSVSDVVGVISWDISGWFH